MSGKTLKAGFGRADVTPKLGVRLTGYGVKERPAEEILDHLHSTALFLEQDGVKAVVINIDWAGVEEPFVERIRAEIVKRVNIDPLAITVSTIHTHSAPDTLNLWGWGGANTEYMEESLPKIVKSVEEAAAKLAEVSVGMAETESLTGVNRRGLDEKGGVTFAASLQDPFDPTMTVVRFRGEDGKDVGSVVHYGAHGTAMGINRLVSRDWIGVMKDRIESLFKAPVLFLPGPIGDVGPRMNKLCGNGLDAGAGDGVHAVREVGYRAATDAVRAMISIKEWRNDFKLSVASEEIFIPFAPLIPLADAERDKAKWEPRKEDFGTPMCEYMFNSAVIEAWKKPPVKGRPFRQVVTVLGPLAIVPVPGEIFSAISLRIRKGSPFQRTLVCSITNGELGYMPTREARGRGGYETWVGRAFSPYLLADNIDDVMVSENLRLLKKIG